MRHTAPHRLGVWKCRLIYNEHELAGENGLKSPNRAGTLQGMCVCASLCLGEKAKCRVVYLASIGLTINVDQCQFGLILGTRIRKILGLCDVIQLQSPARRRSQLIRPVTIHLLWSPQLKWQQFQRQIHKLQRRTLQSNRTLTRESIPHETANVTFEPKPNIVHSLHSRKPKSAKKNRFICSSLHDA